MNAHDVIESYVHDVAVRLPRRQRGDVALELRTLLGEELEARSRAAGRDPDATMATELARAFGPPAEVAARYRPTLTIIDPADGHAFLRATLIGLTIIWCLGLVLCLQQRGDGPSGIIRALQQWWGSYVIPSLWWPGVLVVGFGAAAWSRRRSRVPEWKPRAADRIRGDRPALAMGLIGILFGLSFLVDPRGLVEMLTGGRAAAAVYQSFIYTDAFRRHQAPVLLALLALDFLMRLAVLLRGRWSLTLRRIERGLALTICAALVWTAASGAVLVGPSGDRLLRSILVVLAASMLIGQVITLRREVRPAPQHATPA